MIAFVKMLVSRISKKREYPIYQQHDSSDCGPTSLAMIAKYFGKTYSRQKLRELCHLDRQGVSLAGLSHAAECIGFRTLGAKVSMEQLWSSVPLPCIAHWKQNHFIVIYEITKNRIEVGDPGIGLLTYTKDEFNKNWLSFRDKKVEYGILLMLQPTPSFYDFDDDKPKNKKNLKFLFSYLKGFERFIVQLIIGIVVLSTLQLILPFLSQSVVDIGIVNQDISFIFLMLIGQLIIFFSRTAVDFIQNWIILHIGIRVNVSIMSDFLSKLMRLKFSFFDSTMTGDLLQRIQDNSRIQELLTTNSINVPFSLIGIIVFSTVLAVYSLKILTIFAIGTLLYLLYVLFFLKRRKELDYKRFSHLAANQNQLIEIITGMPEIKMYNGEQQSRWNWEQVQARLFRSSMQSLTLDQIQQGGATVISETKNIVITFLVVQEVINGRMTLGMLLAVQYIIGQLNGPLNQLIGFLHTAQNAKISLDRLNEVRELEDEERIGQNAYVIPQNESITFSQASFRYGGPYNKPVLKNLNLIIPSGKVTAIVGTTGSGKTTLLKLLLKFYEIEGGEIRLGEMDFRNISHQLWRKQCGVVMQDGFLFSDTILNNIVIGDDNVNMSRFIDAMQIAHIQQFVELLPLGYNTKIGREGIGLSKGEQQRILIARSIYKDPKYLFFDEATSALDAETERVIVNNLRTFYNGRTVVIIAHRLSTVKNADQIIVLEKGEIIESGVHDELVKKKGSYFRLISNQLEIAD